MTEMEKVKAEPRRAMIRSKEGKRTAMTTKRIMVTTRTVILNMPRVSPDIPTSVVLGDTVRTSRPAKISIVLMIGRALREMALVEGNEEWGSELDERTSEEFWSVE